VSLVESASGVAAAAVAVSEGMGNRGVREGGSEVAGKGQGQGAGAGASDEGGEARKRSFATIDGGKSLAISSSAAELRRCVLRRDSGARGWGDGERHQVRREEGEGARIGDRGGGVGRWPMWRSIGCSIGTFATAWYVEKCTGAAKLCEKRERSKGRSIEGAKAETQQSTTKIDSMGEQEGGRRSQLVTMAVGGMGTVV